MAEVLATRRVPGKVTGIQTIPKTRGVVSRWTEPAAWSDGSTDDFTEDAVQRYDVELWRAGAMRDDARVKGNRKFWPMTKAEAQLTGYSTKVFAVGVDGDALDADPPAGSATPEAIVVDLAEVTGDLDYMQTGSLGISRWGTTTAMNNAASSGQVKLGDFWINTSFSPTRIYRYTSSGWVYEVSADILKAGTVLADGIIAGSIDGETISGVTMVASIFRTSTTNPKIEIANSWPDTIRFINAVGTLRGEIRLLADDALGIASAGAFKTGPGIPIVIGETAGFTPGASLHNYLELVNTGGNPPTPAAGRLRLYWHDVSGTAQLRTRQDNGVIHAITRVGV